MTECNALQRHPTTQQLGSASGNQTSSKSVWERDVRHYTQLWRFVNKSCSSFLKDTCLTRVARHSLYLSQIWLLVGPSAEEMSRCCSRVRCILTDTVSERLMASMVDCLPELFQLMDAPRTKATASHAHFDLCLQSPGWMNQWGSLLWFLSWFGGMRALVGFFRLSMIVSQLCRHVREDVND